MNTTDVLVADGVEAGNNRAVGDGGPLTVSVCKRWEELECLRPEWNRILNLNRQLTVFSTPEWLGSWWHVFGQDKQLHAVVFRSEQGELVGLVLLYMQRLRSSVLPPMLELRLVGDGSGDSDNLDFVVVPGNERIVATSLVQHLATLPEWSICKLNCMPSDSLVARAFIEEIDLAGWNIETLILPWSAVALPETWEAYLKQLSPKERGKVGNRLRRLQSHYETRIFKCGTLSELPACLEKLFALHQKRWQLRGQPGTFASPARRRFYSDMGRRFLSEGWLEFWVLELNGVAVGAQYGFRYRDTMYSLQEGFDPAYRSDSVGYVLRSYVLRQLIQSGVRRYEFLAGKDESKGRWGCIAGSYLCAHLARPWTQGSLRLSLSHDVRTMKSWIRGSLPSFLLRSLKRMSRFAAPSVEGPSSKVEHAREPIQQQSGILGKGMADVSILPDPGEGRAAPLADDYSVSSHTCTSWGKLERFSPEWEALLTSNHNLTIFSTQEWLRSWWNVHGSGAELLAPVFLNRAGEIVGLAPFCIESSPARVVKQLRRLRFVGASSGDSDNLDILVRPGWEQACAKGFISWLQQAPQWDICSLETVPKDSKCALEIAAAAESANWTVFRREIPNTVLLLPDTWEAYLEQLTPEFRPLLTRYPRRLASRYSVRIYRSDSERDLPRHLESLFAMHQKRWQMIGQPGAFQGEKRRQFYLEMAKAFLRRGWLQFWILELNGTIAAAQFSFQYRDSVYLLQEGFDPKYSQDKVGYALRAAVLQHLIQSGVKRYDFLGGDDAYKIKFGGRYESYLNLLLAKPRSLGSCYLRLQEGKRDGLRWLRRTLPAPLVRMLRRTPAKVATSANRDAHN